MGKASDKVKSPPFQSLTDRRRRQAGIISQCLKAAGTADVMDGIGIKV